MGRLGRSTHRTERRVFIEIFLDVNRVVERSHFSPCTYHLTYLEVKLQKTPLGGVPFMAESIRNSNSIGLFIHILYSDSFLCPYLDLIGLGISAHQLCLLFLLQLCYSPTL